MDNISSFYIFHKKVRPHTNISSLIGKMLPLAWLLDVLTFEELKVKVVFFYTASHIGIGPQHWSLVGVEPIVQIKFHFL